MSEQTMVERVARAICVAHGLNPDEPAESVVNHPLQKLMFAGMRQWEPFAKHARAAIEAMREPTDAMLVAAELIEDPYGGGYASANAHWDAMISEALKP